MVTRSAGHRIRDAILAANGKVGGSSVLTHVPQPLTRPFGSAEQLEHECVEAVAVGEPKASPRGTGFLDGIQRYSVVGRFGLVPVVRGYVAAAVLGRRNENLCVRHQVSEEFVATSIGRLSGEQLRELENTRLPLYDSGGDDREHPILDMHLAARVVEDRRERAEQRVILSYLRDRPEGWLVVDGSIAPYLAEDGASRILGLIKSHETQFLEGEDLRTAMTLPVGHRSSVFARRTNGRDKAYTWYLRLWPWDDRGLLHGLVRLELAPVDEAVVQASEISAWMLSERSPLSAPDSRWDRLIYPMRQVESYLRAQVGEWL
ncbi:MAG: hypothetical protein JSW51_13700 [Gemmatimonadota bacterium]|nr:MAG: hypothetical protein JSW51_13700 [Gemmatimonadota bacterium]